MQKKNKIQKKKKKSIHLYNRLIFLKNLSKKVKKNFINFYIKKGKKNITEKQYYQNKKIIRQKLKKGTYIPYNSFNIKINKKVKNKLLINFSKKKKVKILLKKLFFQKKQLKKNIIKKRLIYNDIFFLSKLLKPLLSKIILKKIPTKKNKRLFYIKHLSINLQIKYILFIIKKKIKKDYLSEMLKPSKILENKKNLNKSFEQSKFNIKFK